MQVFISCFISATVALINIILFVVLHNRNYYLVPALVLGKLYSNTALAVLNSRIHISGGRSGPSFTDISFPSRLLGRGEDRSIITHPQVVSSHGGIPLEGINVQSDIWSDGLTVGDVEVSLEDVCSLFPLSISL